MPIEEQTPTEELFPGVEIDLEDVKEETDTDAEALKAALPPKPAAPQSSRKTLPPPPMEPLSSRKTPPPPPIREVVSKPPKVNSTSVLNSTVTLGVVLAMQGALIAAVLAVAGVILMRIGSLEMRLENSISGLQLDLFAARENNRRLDERMVGLENDLIRAKEERARTFELLGRMEKAIYRLEMKAGTRP